jgi:hypothetical protein
MEEDTLNKNSTIIDKAHECMLNRGRRDDNPHP